MSEPRTCPQGHPYLPENRVVLYKRGASGQPVRNGTTCLLCRRYSHAQRVIGSYSWRKKEQSRARQEARE